MMQANQLSTKIKVNGLDLLAKKLEQAVQLGKDLQCVIAEINKIQLTVESGADVS